MRGLLDRLRAYLRIVEIKVSNALRLPHRYSFERKRDFYGERVGIAIEILAHKAMCRLGDHVVKFGSWPYCIYCQKAVKA